MYGSQLITLLGEGAQQSFARSWGVSYGLNSAAEFRSILIAAAKGAFVLAVLERLFLTGPAEWLEENVDFFSLQALLYTHKSAGLREQIRTFYKHTKRIGDAG